MVTYLLMDANNEDYEPFSIGTNQIRRQVELGFIRKKKKDDARKER